MQIADPIFDALPDAALIFDSDLRLLKQNSAHEQMTRTRREDVVGQLMFDAFPPAPGAESASAEKAIRASTARVLETGKADEPLIQEHALKTYNGTWETHYWRIKHVPVLIDNRPKYIMQISKDVTEDILERTLGDAQRVAAEAAAATSEFSYDPVSGIFLRPVSVDQLFGFDAGEAGMLATRFFERIYAEDLPSVDEELDRIYKAPLGTPASFDFRVLIPQTGKTKYVRARGEMVIDPKDKIRKLVGVFVDMTDALMTRRELEQTVREKENLLIEVNHRVKNSLQLVTSVLRLEARRISDPVVLNILEKAKSRVEAIASVHGELYIGGDVTQVATKPLIDSLVESIGRSIGAGDLAAEIECQTDDFSLPTDAAVGFGLLISELLTNAVKYGGAKGSAPVTLVTARNGDQVHVSIANDIADAQLTENENSTGVGTRLIKGFTRQLKAEMLAHQTDGRYVVDLNFALPGSEVPQHTHL